MTPELKAKFYEGSFLETVRDAWLQELAPRATIANWSELCCKAIGGEVYRYGNHYGIVLEKDAQGLRGVEFGTVIGYAGTQEGFHVRRKYRLFSDVELSPFKRKSKPDAPPSDKSAARQQQTFNEGLPL